MAELAAYQKEVDRLFSYGDRDGDDTEEELEALHGPGASFEDCQLASLAAVARGEGHGLLPRGLERSLAEASTVAGAGADEVEIRSVQAGPSHYPNRRRSTVT